LPLRGGRRIALLLGCAGAILATAGFGASSARAEFGFREAGLSFAEADGRPATRAGSHPFALTASMMFNTVGSGESLEPDESLRGLRIELPAGLSGTPAALPHCWHSDFRAGTCPTPTAVGIVQLLAWIKVGEERSGSVLVQAPIYNLTPVAGTAAELGVFVTPPAGADIPITVQLGISSEPPNRLFASIADVPSGFPLIGFRLVLWGDPGDRAHDPYRGQCGSGYIEGGEAFEFLSAGLCPIKGGSQSPLLSLPTSCGASTARFEAVSWFQSHSTVSVEASPLVGCQELPFHPEVRSELSNGHANSPSGLQLRIDMPDHGLLAPDQVVNSQLGEATIALPAGFALNPPFASGLGVCTEQQLSEELSAVGFGAQGCPQDSQAGVAELITPLIRGNVEGRIYVAQPAGLFDGGAVLDLVLKAPQRGVSLVQPILLEADPNDGGLEATIAGMPQIPFAHLELRFNAGVRAPLATPTTCGTHQFTYTLQPSSGSPPVVGSQAFTIDGNCPVPFQPSLSSQLGSNVGGSSTNLALRVATASRESSPASLSLTLPPGLSVALGAVPLCPQAAAANGACPAGSRIGEARVGVGAGPVPLTVPPESKPGADVFLAGPFQGAPFSLVVRLPTQAGPFDLGTAIIPAAIAIDPETAQATIRFEALPRILGGVPLRYRELDFLLDRPGLIRNPTSCAKSRITGTATSTDGEAEAFSDSFQVADCAALPFNPRLALRLSGSLSRNGHPAVHAALRSSPGEANISAASFTLPKGELLDIRHLSSLCSAGLAFEQCPAGSRLGRIRLLTPLLSNPLTGPIYLIRPSRRLPDLVADLEGGGVRMRLHGHIVTPGGRVGVEFDGLPDLPISTVGLLLPGGRRGLVVNSKSLCGVRPRATAELRSHNGRRRHLRPPLLGRQSFLRCAD
jgi:hypothetical protein